MRSTGKQVRAVAPKHASRAPRTPFALLVLGLIVGGMCALLALNTASAANEVGRHTIAAKDQSVAAQLVQLQNDAQASSAPANLAAAAAALGMVPAGNPAFLEIGPDGRVRVLGSPAPATAAPVIVPKPTKAKPKPTPTSTKSTDKKPKSATKTVTTKSAPTSSHAPTSTAKHSPSPKPTPTPTPTPNSTLPGGTR